ncbi:MAG TPA: hypothetical protein VGB39_07000, partial [Sphingomicrobium sp.]
LRDRFAWPIAIGSGLALWTLANLVERSQEPWDAAGYWTIWLPLGAAICIALGFAFPARPWRWPLAVMLAQLPVMLAFNGEFGSFLVPGLALLMVMALLALPFALLGAFFRRKFA